MRIAFSIILSLLVVALGVCYVKARRSPKAIGYSVALLIGAIIPPLIGNLIIISSTGKALSTVGCYIYFIGMDVVMFALLRFALDYCMIPRARWKYAAAAWALLGVDAAQLLLNPFLGHAFGTEPIPVEGADYYRLLPYAGQTFHRVVDYGILAAIIVIFLVKMIRSPRINSERYSVILATMLITAAWETAYIFSRTPIDRAMIGFGVFGLLVYYLALFYRPMRLLDSMLAQMASEMPDALFFFDGNGQCIWSNRPGIALIGLEGDVFESANERLRALFGDYEGEPVSQREAAVGGMTRSFVLEKHDVTDDRQRLIGSFLSVRDNTVEQEALQHEIYKATHDSLTSLYNRAGYDLLLTTLDLKTTCLLLIDADGFKGVNDTHGHEVGDRVLRRIAETIRGSFRAEDCVCRLGGDEFVVFMARTGQAQRALIVNRVDRINEALARAEDGLPPLSVSVGIAYGGKCADPEKLFERADRALYATKKRGKRGYTFYDEASA